MEKGQAQENVLEIGIDEYLDYEQRMQGLIGAKKNEKAKYEPRIEEKYDDAVSVGGTASDKE